jgi:hypothetical protein
MDSYIAETHLVCDYRPARRSCVCCNHHAAVKQGAHNGGSCAGCLGQRDALCVEGGIAVVVGEVEAGHGGVGVRVAGEGGVVQRAACSSGVQCKRVKGCEAASRWNGDGSGVGGRCSTY